jgi:hypothetical protein
MAELRTLDGAILGNEDVIMVVPNISFEPKPGIRAASLFAVVKNTRLSDGSTSIS